MGDLLRGYLPPFSLDTLQPERFQEINGGQLIDILDGLVTAKQAGFKTIKINMVIMKGINIDPKLIS